MRATSKRQRQFIRMLIVFAMAWLVAVPQSASASTYISSGTRFGANSGGNWYVYTRHCEEGYCYPGRYRYGGYNSIDYVVWCTNTCGSADHYWLQLTRHHMEVIVFDGRYTPFELEAAALTVDYEWIHHKNYTKKRSLKGTSGDSCIAGSYDLLLCEQISTNESYWDPGVIGVAGVTTTGYENTGYNSGAYWVATTSFGN